MGQNTISQLERGERRSMPSTVRKLAHSLGVDPSVLMAEARIDVSYRTRSSLLRTVGCNFLKILVD